MRKDFLYIFFHSQFDSSHASKKNFIYFLVCKVFRSEKFTNMWGNTRDFHIYYLKVKTIKIFLHIAIAFLYNLKFTVQKTNRYVNEKKKSSWRCRGSNPGPFTCKANALPLRYIPFREKRIKILENINFLVLQLLWFKNAVFWLNRFDTRNFSIGRLISISWTDIWWTFQIYSCWIDLSHKLTA